MQSQDELDKEVKSGKLKRTLTALFSYHPNGREREPEYVVFWKTDKGEVWSHTDRQTFYQVLNTAGEPFYTEPGYWAFQDSASQ